MMRMSFVIPAYNEERNIAKCLDAITREVAGMSDVEIIVVDNASTDKTSEIAARYLGVNVVREDQKGIVFARQKGYVSSTGELIANVDSDTMITSGWATNVLKEFARDEELVALSGPFIYYDLSAGTRMMVRVFYYLGYVTHLLNQHIFHKGGMLQGGNFILRRSALDKINGYNLAIHFYGEDTDVARRIAEVGKVKFMFTIPALTSGRRLKEEGVLRTGLRYALNYFWILFFKKPYTTTSRDIRV